MVVVKLELQLFLIVIFVLRPTRINYETIARKTMWTKTDTIAGRRE